MEQGAIKEIQNTAIMATQPDRLKLTDAPTVALPKDMEVKSLEQFMAIRSRFRGCMETTSIDDLIMYVRDRSENMTGRPACFIDSEKMFAKTIFNIGTTAVPGHADDKAVLRLKMTAPYMALLAINGNQQPQKNMAEWLEDWRENLEAIGEDGEEMDMKKAIAAVRRAVIEATRSSEYEDREFGASRSAMESIDARGKDGALPRAFCFRCVPYEGLTSREFYMRLSLTTGSDAPRFTLRIIQLEKAQEQMAFEFRDLLIGNFADEPVSTYVGTFTP